MIGCKPPDSIWAKSQTKEENENDAVEHSLYQLLVGKFIYLVISHLTRDWIHGRCSKPFHAITVWSSYGGESYIT